MSRIKKVLWGGRRRRVVTVVSGLALFGASVGLAVAFFTGALTGQIGGRVASSSPIGDLVLSQNTAASGALYPGGTVAAGFDVNNPTTGTVTIKTVTVGTIASNPSCNLSAVHFTGSGLVGRSFPPGITTGATVSGAWSADANLDPACTGVALGVSLTGTTEGTGP
jgi:hypothetical protein